MEEIIWEGDRMLVGFLHAIERAEDAAAKLTAPLETAQAWAAIAQAYATVF